MCDVAPSPVKLREANLLQSLTASIMIVQPYASRRIEAFDQKDEGEGVTILVVRCFGRGPEKVGWQLKVLRTAILSAPYTNKVACILL